MLRKVTIDGMAYDVGSFSSDGKILLDRIQFAQLQIQTLSNQKALLIKARNAYIADLKSEIVRGRSGIDLVSLIQGD